MASYNRIILVGNLTRDPELSYTPSNTAISKFGMAMNHKWRDQEGNTREEVCFVDCVIFGRRAETFNQYMSKGQQTLVEGRLKLDQWTSPEGQKRSKHEVVVDNFQFLGGRRDEGSPQPAAPGAQVAPGGAEPSAPDYAVPPPPPEDGIPF